MTIWSIEHVFLLLNKNITQYVIFVKQKQIAILLQK